jgi:hypothetical protein
VGHERLRMVPAVILRLGWGGAQDCGERGRNPGLRALASTRKASSALKVWRRGIDGVLLRGA